MKVLTCTICGRNVLVGNATKTVVCAICSSSLTAKIKKEQKEREQERRSCANPDCYNTLFLLYLGSATAVMRAKMRRNGLSPA